MYINLNHIQDLFKENRTILRKTDEYLCLTGFQYLKMAPTKYSHHMVYLTDSVNEVLEKPLIENVHLVIVAQNADETERILSEKATIPINYLIVEAKNFDEVSIKLQDFYDANCGCGFLADSFIDYLVEDTSIQDIVEHASAHALKNPVFVFDASFNLIASYTDFPNLDISEPTARLIANQGFSSDEFQQAKNNRIHERVMSTEQPIFMHNETTGFDQMLCAITTKRNWGHIVMNATNHPFTPTDKVLFYLLKKVIHERLQKNEFIRNNKGYSYESYLRDLLEGKIATNKRYLDRMNYFSGDFSGNFMCIVVEMARSGNLIDIRHIRNQFDSKLSHSKTLIYADQLVILLCLGNKQHLAADDMRKIKEICKEQGIYAGLSNLFPSVVEIQDYYKQALRAIEIGIQYSNDPGLFRYQDYFMQHMMNMFIQKESIKTFCHPAMRTLLEYDNENQTQLAMSLVEWIKSERNASAAADALQIHRNTMIYRLKKIDELVSVNYDDISERQYLALSYELNLTK